MNLSPFNPTQDRRVVRRRQAGSALVIAGLGLATAILFGLSGVLYASKKKQAEKLAEAKAQIEQMSQLRKEAVTKDADVEKMNSELENLKRELATSKAARQLAERDLAKARSDLSLAKAENAALKAENAEMKVQIQTLQLQLKTAKATQSSSYQANRSRRETPQEICIKNLRRIQGAKKQWAIYEKKTADETPKNTDIFGPIKFISVQLYCPEGGNYQLGKVGEKPACSHAGHAY